MRRLIPVLTLCLMLMMTGCSAALPFNKVVFTTGFEKDEVFRIEDSTCTLSEAMVYLVGTQGGYEKTFGKDIWNADTDSGTVEQRLKDSVLAKIAQIKVMNLLARENGIELDQSEEQQVLEAAQEYYDTLTDADIAAMNGVTVQDMEGIIREQAIADKLYDYIIRDINPEISDDEARTITVEQIFIKTYSLDGEGNKVPFSDDEKDAAYRRCREIFKNLLNGGSFEELMAQYNEADEGTISFGKGEKDAEFETAAFNLGTEQTSEIIETQDGYAILKCISTFNREETEANKVKIVAQRKREVFGAQYDAFVATLTKQLNQKLWDSVELVDDENVTTTGFMEVYEQYFHS
ncbi:peptidylprolyl isomerase [Butyrivibrio sp. XPD2006]|uniref:peptidylprolyl isomerase n=1 Tax=Butyrivibrio sp. XPD2006 TaxID=1280668 RepID=UPI0003B59742|nr:peptidylprolyl isomerase [Butyrivibrio sp. XPD2006]